MRHPLSSLAVAAFLAVPVAACVDQADPTADPAAVATDLSAGTGNQTTTDEAPMFGEAAPFAAAAIEADHAVVDPIAGDPTVAALDVRPDVDARQLLVLWGQMPPDRTATLAHDWSGTLSVSRGKLVVERAIAFEAATDSLQPRTSASSLHFTSKTRPAVDGLAIKILDDQAPSATPPPSPSPGLGLAPIVLTYTPDDGTAPIAIDLDQLSHGASVTDLGGGNKLVAVAERRHADCEGGFLRGRWHPLAGAPVGAYRGVVTSRTGEVIGHIRGIYGVRANGDAVMFGKFIDTAGAFKGVVVGTYAGNTFHARWLDRAGEHGTLGGVYFEGAPGAGGGFVGRFAQTGCSEEPAQP
jgi:hypothetical protein